MRLAPTLMTSLTLRRALLLLAGLLVLTGCGSDDALDLPADDDDAEANVQAGGDGGTDHDEEQEDVEVEVSMPDLVGEDLADALEVLAVNDLDATVEGDDPYDRDTAPLVVVDQQPTAEDTFVAGDQVALTAEPDWVFGPCEDTLAFDERFPGGLSEVEDVDADVDEVPYEHAWACENLIEGEDDADRYEHARELADLRADEERFNHFGPVGMAGSVDSGRQSTDPLAVFGWAIAEVDAGKLADVPSADAAGGLAAFANQNQVWNKVVTPVRDTLLLREDISSLDEKPAGSGNVGRFGYVYSGVERLGFDDPDPQLVVAWYEDEDSNERAFVDQVFVGLETVAEDYPNTQNRIGLTIPTRRLDEGEVLDLVIEGGWSEFHSEKVVPELENWHDERFAD